MQTVILPPKNPQDCDKTLRNQKVFLEFNISQIKTSPLSLLLSFYIVSRFLALSLRSPALLAYMHFAVKKIIAW